MAKIPSALRNLSSGSRTFWRLSRLPMTSLDWMLWSAISNAPLPIVEHNAFFWNLRRTSTFCSIASHPKTSEVDSIGAGTKGLFE
eukprot:1510488-Amphidinium_carterae.1